MIDDEPNNIKAIKGQKEIFIFGSHTVWRTDADNTIVGAFGEQRVTQSAKRMSNDVLSYRKICDFLTSVGVSTKKQGKGWQTEMIRRLLNH